MLSSSMSGECLCCGESKEDRINIFDRVCVCVCVCVSCVCACLRSLSREQRLRLQLECVKAACRLDRCLALPHAVCELKRHDADPAADPAATLADEETEVSAVRDC